MPLFPGDSEMSPLQPSVGIARLVIVTDKGEPDPMGVSGQKEDLTV